MSKGFEGSDEAVLGVLEAVGQLQGAIDRLQEAVRNGHRDSIEIDPDSTRPFDELDADFGTAHHLRAK